MKCLVGNAGVSTPACIILPVIIAGGGPLFHLCPGAFLFGRGEGNEVKLWVPRARSGRRTKSMLPLPVSEHRARAYTMEEKRRLRMVCGSGSADRRQRTWISLALFVCACARAPGLVITNPIIFTFERPSKKDGGQVFCPLVFCQQFGQFPSKALQGARRFDPVKIIAY